jgi:alpha-1,3-rhamnosyl/mannosyltransferase
MAEALVHSSYYEELSTATREAAACGTPIVCSDGAGARECTGDGALYFNPHLLADLKAPLYRLLREPSLRRELRGKALAWAARFTWEKTARETLEVYRAAAEEREYTR